MIFFIYLQKKKERPASQDFFFIALPPLKNQILNISLKFFYFLDPVEQALTLSLRAVLFKTSIYK